MYPVTEDFLYEQGCNSESFQRVYEKDCQGTILKLLSRRKLTNLSEDGKTFSCIAQGIKIFLIISRLSWWWPVTDSSVSGLDLVTVLLFGAVAPAEVLTNQNAV
ncbi:unnamed protein product [Pocillopora meandrina]|uniref:Uncharacterized protein n=1 Tax=Pocillopora meandrina TaxID=46732 RepID=A0AAU9WNL3_9CNID|nr:unnamed protein product [Pocillopora meandrina]